jgi:hypothetical protein
MNGNLERIYRKMAVVWSKYKSDFFLGGTEENCEKPNQNCRCCSWEHLSNTNTECYRYANPLSSVRAQLFNIIYINFRLCKFILYLVHFCSTCMPTNITYLFSLRDRTEWDCSLVEFDRIATAAPRWPTGRRWHYRLTDINMHAKSEDSKS